MIEIRHLKKIYENASPLKDVNAVINKGDVISIIGPSGTGKSTLLRCINRLEDATSGEVILDNQNVYSKNYNVQVLRKKVGMVFQSFNLFNDLNVRENIMVAQTSLHKKLLCQSKRLGKIFSNFRFFHKSMNSRKYFYF